MAHIGGTFSFFEHLCRLLPNHFSGMLQKHSVGPTRPLPLASSPDYDSFVWFLLLTTRGFSLSVRLVSCSFRGKQYSKRSCALQLGNSFSLQFSSLLFFSLTPMSPPCGVAPGIRRSHGWHPQRLRRDHGAAFVLNPEIRDVQDCGQWSARDPDPEASGTVRSKVKCERWAGITEEVPAMFSSVLMLQRYLVCWEQGLVASLPDRQWLSWGLSEGFINLVEGCGFLEMKRAPVVASDHPHLQDLPMSLILGVNLLLMVSLQTKVVPSTILINTAHLKFLVTVTYYYRKNCNTRKT